jgi:hypothetical protein
MKKFKIILLLFNLFAVICFSQDCNDYHHWADCRKSIKRNYSIYMEPKSTTFGIKDTMRYNVVFYGNRDYIITFCTDQMYYPINIRLLQPGTREELYDNATDDYCESFGVGFYNTQNLILEVVLLADKLDKDKIKSNDKVCVGMQMQYKKIFTKQE